MRSPFPFIALQRLALSLALAVTAALLAVACGDEKGDAAGTAAPPQSAAANASAEAPAEGSEENVELDPRANPLADLEDPSDGDEKRSHGRRPRGFYRRANRPNGPNSDLSPEQRAMIEQLEAIGYAAGSEPAIEQPTVTVYEKDKVSPGLNLYSSAHGPEAILMDMEGNELHRWSYTQADPDAALPASANRSFWRRAHVFENGDLLAIVGGTSLLKLDKDSRLLWANLSQVHHDLHVTPNGDIYTLTREARLVPRFHPKRPILEDFITVLDSKGKEKQRVSLLECFENSEYAEALAGLKRTAGDIFHTNSIELLDGRIEEAAPAFAAGRVLISLRLLSAIAVVDLEQKSLVWYHTGDFKFQHDARVIDNGNILLFDNRFLKTGSNVIEIDPASLEIEWRYRHPKRPRFFSRYRGTSSRLPNGNTLITESDGGRAFEVTPAGEMVWEFHNPHRAGEQNELIASLNEVIRLEPDFPSHWAQAYSDAEKDASPAANARPGGEVLPKEQP